MPNWRQNLLSAGESLDHHQDQDTPNKKTATDPLAASRKPARHFNSITEAITNIRNGNDGFMTDSSSFADYEDRRTLLDDDDEDYDGSPEKEDYRVFLKKDEENDDSRNYLEEFLRNENHRSFFGDEGLLDRIGRNEELKVDRLSKGVFYVSTKSEYESSRHEDDLSSSTCDSFDKCAFNDFEPFSDTCCCDPFSEGHCTRSPKDLDLDSPDGDRMSNKSLDGLDLTLFEPAASRNNRNGKDKAREANAVVGVLHLLESSANGESGIFKIVNYSVYNTFTRSITSCTSH